MPVTPLSCTAVAWLLATSSAFVDVSARYEPPAVRGEEAAVVVSLVPQQEGIVVNERPAPRLALDPDQKVLVDRQPPKKAGGPPPVPGEAHYLDPKVPVRFPVALAAGASAGQHTVKAVVTYFFCSKEQGWCRKGKTPVDLTVTVP